MEKHWSNSIEQELEITEIEQLEDKIAPSNPEIIVP